MRKSAEKRNSHTPVSSVTRRVPGTKAPKVLPPNQSGAAAQAGR